MGEQINGSPPSWHLVPLCTVSHPKRGKNVLNTNFLVIKQRHEHMREREVEGREWGRRGRGDQAAK